MAPDPGLGLDPFKNIVNVHWQEEGFLYSGADGMFGSKDGEEWKRAPSSVAATSLAWVDNVWVACGPDGTWRSEDGAKTWQSSGPQLRQVAAIKPAGVDSEGQPLPGMFAGFSKDFDPASRDGAVYTSSDGKSWSIALTIAGDFGDGGTEFITGLSGCGGAFFVGTVHSINTYSSSSAKFYSSFDGHDFSGEIVATGTFWNGDIQNVPALLTDYSPGGVGYDKKNQMYLATIYKQDRTAVVFTSYMQASGPSSGSFDEGSQVEQASIVSSNGDLISVYPSAAGGDGTFVGGSALRHFSDMQTGGEVRAHWLPGGSAQTLEAYTGAISDEFIGSFCFIQIKKDTGVFACVAYGAGAAGGVYIATAGGSFRKTHSGQGIVHEGQPAGAVAVGKIKFLGSADAGL